MGNTSRPGLCRGRRVTGVPTADMYDLPLTVDNNKTSILLAGWARIILAV